MRFFLIALIFTFSACTSRAETSSTFDSLYNYMKIAMTAACANEDNCTRKISSFLWFVWNNRDKSDVQFNLVKCTGYSAVKRGYIWSPTKLLDDLTPKMTQEVAVEVCECVTGYWAQKTDICSSLG